MKDELPEAEASELADLEDLRARVRADRRTVSAPLVVFGALVVLHAAVLFWVATTTSGAGARHTLLFLYWPFAGALAVFVLSRHARRIAERAGVGGGPRSHRAFAVRY